MTVENGGCIRFDSRREIESVMAALGEHIEENPNEKGYVQELYDLLDYLHMMW